MSTIRCIGLDVYRCNWDDPTYDPTNGGISGQVDTIYVPHPRGCWNIEEDDPRLFKLVVRNMFGEEVRHLEPAYRPPEGCTSWMSGGNFAASCDSRAREIIGFYGAISLHDRTDTWEQYEMLSR